jgi:hypothetical protein
MCFSNIRKSSPTRCCNNGEPNLDNNSGALVHQAAHDGVLLHLEKLALPVHQMLTVMEQPTNAGKRTVSATKAALDHPAAASKEEISLIVIRFHDVKV